MRTAFPALIKSISVKSLVSGDKEGEIRLRFLPTDEVMDALQRLHRADEEVMIAIVDPAENISGIQQCQEDHIEKAKVETRKENRRGQSVNLRL
jgi:hypothetical protein